MGWIILIAGWVIISVALLLLILIGSQGLPQRTHPRRPGPADSGNATDSGSRE